MCDTEAVEHWLYNYQSHNADHSFLTVADCSFLQRVVSVSHYSPQGFFLPLSVAPALPRGTDRGINF